ncbi:MAG: putative Ig domain-containing protein [Actinomycetota bacterium]|nr:putative Ig domain-containing protein [Actinomycetota bacterium]MDQ2955933.1 putative Ig domain-containing protein [Actinomycetota bacterium]
MTRARSLTTLFAIGVTLALSANAVATASAVVRPDSVRASTQSCSQSSLPLPDPACTPGATYSAVSQSTINSTICVSGWTATVRPPTSYTDPLKVQQIGQYGYTDTSTADYEEDHFIPLELGGDPRSPLNLWPEPHNAPAGNTASSKDSVENQLKALVCAGKATLVAAQQAIATNWTTAVAVVSGTGASGPTTPLGVQITGTTSSSVTLSWTASSDASSTITGYSVYTGSTLAASATTTSATVTGLTPGTSYTFAVSAKDAAGQTSPVSAPATATTPATAAAVPRPDHVVVVMMENHSYADIIGSSSAPYINSLASGGATFTQSFAVTHPSEPNYLALFSGSTQGLTSDSCPNTFTGANLGSELIAKQLTFTGYSETMPSNGYTGCTSGNYARKHNPWVNFSNVPAASNLTFGSYPTSYSTLPTLSFVIPNLQDDMHDGTVAQGDTWLQQHIDGYAQWAKTHNSLLVLTWDEDDNSANNQIPTILVGAQVKTGSYSETINHYSVLRTLEDAYGLPYAGASSTATPITDVWTGSGSGTNTVTVTNPGSQTGTVGTAASLQIHASDSASGQTLSYAATGLPGGLTISPSSGLISGTPTTAGTSSVTVTVTDGTGASGQTNFSWTVSGGGTGCSGQKLGNPGFETGTASPWTASSGVISNSATEPPHTGTWDAWLDGYGTAHTQTLSQSVTIPAGCHASLSFWLHIDTAETSTTTAYDTLTAKIASTTLATYSNLNHNTGYAQKTVDLSSYAGQTITITFTGTEDSTLQTSFVLDDTAVTLS